MKRYTIEIDFYGWAENDEKIKAHAKAVCDKLNQYEDCQANVLKIYETPFASMVNRELKNIK